MEKVKYFKQHIESWKQVRTIYGCYSDKDILPEGDVLCKVRDVTKDEVKDHIEYDAYMDFIEPDEVTYITKEEYIQAIKVFRKADKLYCKADELLKNLMV